MGSEMCIRDSSTEVECAHGAWTRFRNSRPLPNLLLRRRQGVGRGHGWLRKGSGGVRIVRGTLRLKAALGISQDVYFANLLENLLEVYAQSAGTVFPSEKFQSLPSSITRLHKSGPHSSISSIHLGNYGRVTSYQQSAIVTDPNIPSNSDMDSEPVWATP